MIFIIFVYFKNYIIYNEYFLLLLFFYIKVKVSLLNTFENNFDGSRCNDDDSTLSTPFHEYEGKIASSRLYLDAAYGAYRQFYIPKFRFSLPSQPLLKQESEFIQSQPYANTLQLKHFPGNSFWSNQVCWH